LIPRVRGVEFPPEALKVASQFMGREEVEIAFGTAFTDPGSVKSGEYLREHILAAAERFVASDRSALLEVLT